MKMHHLVEAESIWALSQKGTVNLPQVKALQDKLRAAGHDPGASDGWYGQKTANAVRSYQQANNLKVDGDAGPQTLSSLGMGGANTSPPAETPPAETPPAPAARQPATEPEATPTQTEPEATTTPRAEPVPTTPRAEPEPTTSSEFPTEDQVAGFLRNMKIDDTDYFDIDSAPSVEQGKYPSVTIYLKPNPEAFEEQRLRDFFKNFRNIDSPEALDYIRTKWPEKRRTETKTGAQNVIYTEMKPYLYQVFDQLVNEFDFVNETRVGIFLQDDRGNQISGYQKEVYSESIQRLSDLAGL